MERVKYDNENRISMIRHSDVSKYYDEKGNLRAYVKNGQIKFYTNLNMFSMRINEKIPGMLYSQELKHNQEQRSMEKWIEDKVQEIVIDSSAPQL